MSAARDEQAAALEPEVEVRRRLGDRPLRLQLVAPPYPAIGCGELRALRIVEREGIVELAAGYERYRRLGPRGRSQ
ncbi:MAG: hypothetical protein ACREM8_04670 [Vulcanimicrobiaceae bacterium]